MELLKKIGKWALIVIFTLTMIILGARLSKRFMYGDFFANSTSHGDMPGLFDGFVPQGLETYGDGFFVAGYMTDDSASRLYYVKDGEKPKTVILKKANGEDFTGHCGGVAIGGNYFYVGGSGGMYVFSLDDITDGDGEAKQIGKFEAGMTASWVYTFDGYVYIGTFADGGEYKSQDWQSCETPAGDKNPSLMTRFKIDPEEELGLSPLPDCAWSIRHWVQGAAVTPDGIILSTSSGINASSFYFYPHNDSYKGEVVYDEGGEKQVTIPLYYLDSQSSSYVLNSIPMAEEIEVVGGRLYVANESACGKYLFGWLLGGEKFYSTELKERYWGK